MADVIPVVYQGQSFDVPVSEVTQRYGVFPGQDLSKNLALALSLDLPDGEAKEKLKGLAGPMPGGPAPAPWSTDDV